MSNFRRQGIPDRRSSIRKRAMSKCFALTCGMHRIPESEEEQISIICIVTGGCKVWV